MLRTKFFGRLLLLPALLAGLSGCASSLAQRGYLGTVEQTESDVYGAWITVESTSADSIIKSGGEFLACDSGKIFVLKRSGAVGIDTAAILTATIEVHSNNPMKFAGWTILGAVSTISHGGFLIISAPMWLTVGIASAATESRYGRYMQSKPTPAWWEEKKKFSRFPQGIPPGFQLDKLKPGYASKFAAPK